MTTTTTNGQGTPFNKDDASFKEEDTSFNGEDAFIDGLEKLAGILTGVAEKFDALADSFGVSEEEIDELNAGKTEDQIRLDDAISSQIAAPLVNALDSMTAILNSANEEIMDMVFDDQSDTEQSE